MFISGLPETRNEERTCESEIQLVLNLDTRSFTNQGISRRRNVTYRNYSACPILYVSRSNSLTNKESLALSFISINFSYIFFFFNCLHSFLKNKLSLLNNWYVPAICKNECESLSKIFPYWKNLTKNNV